MGKIAKVVKGARLVERLIAIPGMWDDLAAWKRWVVKGLAGGSFLSFRTVRGWIMDSGSSLDWSMWVFGLLCIPAAAYVIVGHGLMEAWAKSRADAQLPLPGQWLDREDAEIEIETSTAFMNRILPPGGIAQGDMRRLRSLSPVEIKTASEEVSDRYQRELTQRMRRQFVAAHPEAYWETEDWYHEDTLQAWLDEVRDPPEPEPDRLDPFSLLGGFD